MATSMHSAPQITDDDGAPSKHRTGTTRLASETAAITLGAVRRSGAALHLASIAMGLATIPTALRFQTARLRELGAG